MSAASIGMSNIQPHPPSRGRHLLVKYFAKLKTFLYPRQSVDQLPSASKLHPASRVSENQLTPRENRWIFTYLKDGEYVEAIMRGDVSGAGGAFIVATDSRIIYLRKTLFFTKYEELPYGMVAFIMLTPTPESLSRVSIYATTKTYRLANVHVRMAQNFIGSVASNPGLAA